MPVGFDLGALMAIGAGEGACLPALAALLPAIEAGALAGFAKTRDDGGET